MVKKKIICPKCGQENLFPTKECVRCGSSFILFPELRGLFEKGEQRKSKTKEPISKTDNLKGEILICPKCGQENDSLSLECSRCGIVFLKYYDIQAREETDEEKKAELLAKKEKEEEKTEALAKKKEEQERAEALRRQKEEEEAEALRRQKEEEEAEALRRQKEEEELAEALRKQKEEEEKAKALQRQKKEEEREEALRRKKEEEEKAESLRKQKEAEEQAEALRKQKEEEEAEALRRQKEEEEAEALRRQKEEEERAEALRKQKEEEEKAKALQRQKKEEEKKELQKKIDEITNVLKPKAKIKDLLKKYEGQTVGINHDSATTIKGADLIKVGDDLFSILLVDEKIIKSYPLRTITSIIEGVNGVSDGNAEEKSQFSIVILVHHPVI